MITSVRSLPRGACSSRPLQYELSPAEVEMLESGEAEDEDEEEEVEEDPEDVADVRLSPSDAVFLTGRVEEDGSCVEMHVYDARGSLYVHHDVALPAFPLAIEWVGSSFVATGTSNSTIEVWNFDVLDPLEPTLVLDGDAPVVGLAWNRLQTDCLAAGSSEAGTTLWDLAANKAVWTWNVANAGQVQGLAWHPIEKPVLATGADDKRVLCRDCRAADVALALDATAEVQDVAWRAAHELLAACDDGSLLCLDPRRPAKPTWRLRDAHAASCQGVAVSGDLVATAAHDKRVRVWRADHAKNDGKPAMLLEKNVGAGKLFDVCFDEHAPTLLATAGSKGVLALWDLTDDLAATAADPPSKKR